MAEEQLRVDNVPFVKSGETATEPAVSSTSVTPVPATDEWQKKATEYEQRVKDYEQKLSDYGTKEKTWSQQAEEWKAKEGDLKRLSDYDRWYLSTVKPHWETAEDFHQELLQYLASKQQGTKTAPATTPAEIADDEYLNGAAFKKGLEGIRQEMREPVAQLSEAVQKALGEMEQRLEQKFIQQILPSSFTLYDTVADLRGKNADEPEFMQTLSKVMQEQKITDPRRAYDIAYGERDRKRWEAAKEKEIAERVQKELEAKYGAEHLHVANGVGGFPRFQRPAAGASVDESMNNAAKEIAERHGRGVFGQ